MNRRIISGVVFFLVLAGGVYLFLRLIPPNWHKSQYDPSSGSTDVSPNNKHPQTYKGTATRENPDRPGQSSFDMGAGATNPGETGRPAPPNSQGRSGRLLSETDLQRMTPKELAAIVQEYRNYPPQDQGPLHQALNRLAALAAQGSQPAIEKLAELSYSLNGNQALHQALQALARTNTPTAINALFDALKRNLDNPTETTRITSYFQKSDSGALDPSIVDRFVGLANDPLTNPAAHEVLINRVFQEGGAYGRQQVGTEFHELQKSKIDARVKQKQP